MPLKNTVSAKTGLNEAFGPVLKTGGRVLAGDAASEPNLVRRSDLLSLVLQRVELFDTLQEAGG